jgi:hypothetical protein
MFLNRYPKNLLRLEPLGDKTVKFGLAVGSLMMNEGRYVSWKESESMGGVWLLWKERQDLFPLNGNASCSKIAFPEFCKWTALREDERGDEECVQDRDDCYAQVCTRVTERVFLWLWFRSQAMIWDEVTYYTHGRCIRGKWNLTHFSFLFYAVSFENRNKTQRSKLKHLWWSV